MQDRRRCHRIDAELPIAFRASRYQRHISVGLTQNVSATGLCFLSTQGVDVGQDLSLEIQIPPGDKLNLNTTVVWVRETGYISRDYLIGVRLREPVDEDARKFIRFCARELSRSKPQKKKL